MVRRHNEESVKRHPEQMWRICCRDEEAGKMSSRVAAKDLLRKWRKKKPYCLAYTAYYMYYKYILRYFLDIYMETVDFKFDEIKKEKVKIVKI